MTPRAVVVVFGWFCVGFGGAVIVGLVVSRLARLLDGNK